jgi:hypothetical protein
MKDLEGQVREVFFAGLAYQRSVCVCVCVCVCGSVKKHVHRSLRVLGRNVARVWMAQVAQVTQTGALSQ